MLATEIERHHANRLSMRMIREWSSFHDHAKLCSAWKSIFCALANLMFLFPISPIHHQTPKRHPTLDAGVSHSKCHPSTTYLNSPSRRMRRTARTDKPRARRGHHVRALQRVGPSAQVKTPMPSWPFFNVSHGVSWSRSKPASKQAQVTHMVLSGMSI